MNVASTSRASGKRSRFGVMSLRDRLGALGVVAVVESGGEGALADHFGINLSARQFESDDLVEFISLKMKEYNIAPKFLTFEITESLLKHAR